MAKSPLPLILGAAAAFLILGKKKGAPTVTQHNVYLIETGDSSEVLVTAGGYPAISIISSVAGMTSEAIAAHILPVAQANPDIQFVIAGVGAPADQTSQWVGESAALANQIGVIGLRSAGAPIFEESISSGSLSLQAIDPLLDAAIIYVKAVESSNAGGGAGGFGGGRSLGSG